MQTSTALTLTDLDLSNPTDPRVSDVKLAEALGYERPRVIRELIERHRSSLETFGEIRRIVRRNPRKAGRPAAGYDLNRKQALFVCTKAETPQATAVTIALVEVFDTVMLNQRHPQQALTHRQQTRISNQQAWRIRGAKMRLAEAVGTLDALGVDVARIDIRVVRDFWRQIAA